LLECLKDVPEPRRMCGIRHRAAVVLAFAVAAVLAGADPVTAVSERAADAAVEVLAALDAWQDRRGRRFPPSLRTFRRVLRVLDGEAVAAAFEAWLTGQVISGLADATPLLIALDRKTVRGARTGDGKAPHLLAAMICGARAVIARRDADQETNEITQVAPAAQGRGHQRGAGDAGRDARAEGNRPLPVEDQKADCLTTAVKENQPSLSAALDALDRAGTAIVHTAYDRGHGRGETRTPAGSAGTRRPVPARRPGVPDRAGRPRPAPRRAPLIGRRPRHHQPQPPARRHPRRHRHAARGHWDIEAMHHVRSPGTGLAVASCGADATRVSFSC
jgi:hypothetical protein